MFCGEEHSVSPEAGLTIGRTGDLEIDDNPYLHRTFLVVSFDNGFWWLSNTGSTLTATVADEQGLFQAWLSPGARIPLAMKTLVVWFTAGPTTYDFEIHVASPVFQSVTSDPPETAGGQSRRGRRRHGRSRLAHPGPATARRRPLRALPAAPRGGHEPDPVVGRRCRAARLDPDPLQPQARQRLPEARRRGHPWPARRRRQARHQPQGPPRRARPLDQARLRGRPRPAPGTRHHRRRQHEQDPAHD